MDAHPPDDDPHAKFRELCIVYGDFNRAAFLEEILNFIAGLWRNGAKLSAIRTAVQKRTKQLAKRPQRGRPRACATKPVQTNRSGADIDVGMKRADNHFSNSSCAVVAELADAPA
jgi:hypothetical protein